VFSLAVLAFPQVTDNEIRGNIAAGGAGGIAVVGNPTFALIFNNLIETNSSGDSTSEGRGGGIRVQTGFDAYTKIQNNTLVDNAVAGLRAAWRWLLLLRSTHHSILRIISSYPAFRETAVYAESASRKMDIFIHNDVWNNSPANWLVPSLK